jgi:hypothetical protein
VLHTIKTKTMRLDHHIHALSQLDIMTPSQPRMITFIAILASLVSEKLITDGSNIVMTITVFAVGAKGAKNLDACKLLEWQEGREGAYVADALECAL